MPFNIDDTTVNGELCINPNVPGWDIPYQVKHVHCIEFPYSPKTSLPICKATVLGIGGDDDRAKVLLGAIDLMLNANKNLTAAQKNLLILHFEQGHIIFGHI